MSTDARNWLVRVQEPDGSTHKRWYSFDDTSKTYQSDHLGNTASTGACTVAFVDDLEARVTPNGDSIEASFVIGYRDWNVDVRRRDVITIYVRSASLVYKPVFRGFTVENPNPYDPSGEPQPVRARGLRDALYRVWTGANYERDAGEDLSSVAFNIVENSEQPLPYGITNPNFAALGVTLVAKVNPSSLDAGTNLDALVSIAEAGGVKAVWGVSPHGRVFFEEENTTSKSITEGDETTRTTVVWEPEQSEDVVTDVAWIIEQGTMSRVWFTSDGIGGDPVRLDTPDPVTYRSSSGNTAFGRQTVTLTPAPAVEALIPFPDAVAGETTGTPYKSWVGDAEDSPAVVRWSDDNPVSYTVYTPDNKAVYMAQTVTNTGGGERVLRAISVRLSPHEAGGKVLSSAVWIEGRRNSFSSTHFITALHGVALDDGNNNFVLYESKGFPKINEFIVFGDRAVKEPGGWLRDNDLTVRLKCAVTAETGTPRVSIEDFRVWEINVRDLDAAAEKEYRIPATAPARCVIGDWDEANYGRVSLTKIVGGGVLGGLVVEEKIVRINAERGVEMEFVLGEAFDAATNRAAGRIKERDERAKTAVEARRRTRLVHR